mmetsp:Transcript_8843/g.16688  ORF Transcript_8843/g.16688 Transcript_8843/m.16688 type:complete len:203 (+) Transcript_8843:2416-3024(+)
MKGMFEEALAFNQDISGWNVSAVTDMGRMFAGTFVFDQDISGWDVSKVTSMAAMYFGALAFNHDISGWDVSSVTSMEYMFYGASAFNQDIGGWDISLVNNMESMFDRAYTFNQDLCPWGPLIFSGYSNVTVLEMFTGSGCPNTKSPVTETALHDVPQNFCSTECYPSTRDPASTGVARGGNLVLHNFMLPLLSCGILLNAIQ